MKFALAGKKEDDKILEWGLKLSGGSVILICKKKNDVISWNILTVSEDTGDIYLHKNVSHSLGLRLDKEDRVYITDL